MKKSKKFVLAGLVLAAITTDYAKATGANQNPNGRGQWWLRSPYYYFTGDNARVVSNDGIATGGDDNYVDYTHGAVVPALSISLQ